MKFIPVERTGTNLKKLFRKVVMLFYHLPYDCNDCTLYTKRNRNRKKFFLSFYFLSILRPKRLRQPQPRQRLKRQPLICSFHRMFFVIVANDKYQTDDYCCKYKRRPPPRKNYVSNRTCNYGCTNPEKNGPFNFTFT